MLITTTHLELLHIVVFVNIMIAVGMITIITKFKKKEKPGR
jgi:hypothetical protein